MLHLVPEHWRGYVLALLATFCFSTAVVFTKLGLNLSQADFYSSAIWGWGLAMVLATVGFYIPLPSLRKNLWPDLQKHYRFFTLVSGLTVVNGVAWFYGMSQINGGVVALLDQNVMVWSFLLGALFLGERFSWQQACAILVTVLGLGIISSLKGEVTPLGVTAVLVAGFSIATQSLLMKKYSSSFSALSLTFWRGWSMVLVSWFLWWLLGGFDWYIATPALLALAIGQFFGVFAGRAAYIKAHEYLPMSHLSFFMLGIPVIVLLSSFVWLGEPLGLQKIIGASIMLLGLSWFLTRRAIHQAKH